MISNEKRKAILSTGWALAVYAVILSPVLAVAQEDGETTVLQTITVEGQGRQDAKAPIKGYVAKTSSTATKTGTPLIETQQSISVITRDQIIAQGARTLADVLSYTPGIVSAPSGADPRFDSPSIRGFDGRQMQFLNGLRMLRTAGATPYELYGLERVEVTRGPSSVLYGQGNPGGMINQISKRPTFEPIREVGVQVGNYDYYQTMFDVGGPIGEDGNLAYRLTGVARNAHAEISEFDNDRYFIAPAMTWKPDDDTSLTLLSSFQRDNPSSPSGLPPALTYNRPGNMLPRDFYVGDQSFDRSSRSFSTIGYEFEHRFDETWTFRQNARISSLDWSYRALGMSSINSGMDGGLIRRNATFQDELLNSYNFDNNLQAEFSTGDIEHTMLFGVDYRYFDNNVKTEFWQPTPLDPVNPVYGGPISFLDRTTYADVKTDLTQIGIYIQDEIAYENWRATFGLRQDWASQKGGAVNAGNLASAYVWRARAKDDQKLTGRAGLSYLFDNGIAPYISYATSFEPILVAANGNLFEPTTGEQWEAGVKYQPLGFDGFFSAAIYDLRQKNVLTTNPTTLRSEQIGEVHARGLELEGVASLMDGLNLRAAYTYMDSTIVGGRVGTVNTDGKRFDNVPYHNASLWLDYTFAEDTALEGFGMGAGVRYVGQRYGNAINTYDMAAVTLFDAGIHYEKNGYRASLNFQNLADKEYLSGCSTFGCFYGEGRSVMGKLTYSW